MKKIALILTSFLLFTVSTNVYAEGKGKKHESSSEIEAESQSQNENKFSIKGQIESISSNTFVVNGQEIVIDLSSVNKFKQKGILDPGDWVKVDGIVKEGTFYATNVMAIGEGQGRFQIKVSGISLASGSPSGSPSPSPIASSSPSPSATSTPTSTPEESPSGSPIVTTSPSGTAIATSIGGNIQIKANGPIGLVTRFLEQVLAYLQGLLP